MSLLEKMKGVRYRARIFDHKLHIATVEVPDRGQRYITVTVKKKTLGIFGDETKLAFMINPDIPPKLFGGYIQEIDFDIRDSGQLGDLLDIAPDLVYEVNENYRVIQEERERMKKGSDIESILERIKPVTALTEPEEGAVKTEPKPVPKKPGLLRTVNKLSDTLEALKHSVDGPDKNKLIKECLDLCLIYPSWLNWLPKYLKIDQEIHAICSQTKIKRYGVIPSYYIAQSNAMISEKVLARPAQKPGWQDVIILLGTMIILVAFAALVLRAAGLI